MRPKQPLIEHVSELGRRMLWPVLMLLAGSVLGFVWHEPVIGLLARPLSMPLFYTAPAGGFEFVLWISLVVGMIVSLPVGVYNLVRYIEPATSRRRLRRGVVLGVMAASAALAWLGVVFAYVVILPAALQFFAGFGSGEVKPLISTTAYFSFVTGCLVSFAAIFQLPLLLLFVNGIHRLPPGSLGKYRRHVVVGSFALALILPFTYDPLTQVLVAAPIIGLYEISIGAVWAVNRRRDRAGARAEARLMDAAEAARAEQLERRRTVAMRPRPVMARPLQRLADGRRIVQLG